MTELPNRLLRDALDDTSLTPPSTMCVDVDRLAAWADGTLTGAERASIETHAAGCAPRRDDTNRATATRAPLVAGASGLAAARDGHSRPRDCRPTCRHRTPVANACDSRVFGCVGQPSVDVGHVAGAARRRCDSRGRCARAIVRAGGFVDLLGFTPPGERR